MADVIANVAGKPVSRVTLALIQRLMKRFFGQEYESFSEIKVIEWAKKVAHSPYCNRVLNCDGIGGHLGAERGSKTL